MTRKRNVVNQVKIYRKNMQLSQLDLANQVGVARQTINMIENDKYNPTLDLCLRIAWALESDLNTLFWRDNDENNAG
nr:helix-turn-helix transcriptional regulator [Enterococcus sp. MJM12]